MRKTFLPQLRSTVDKLKKNGCSSQSLCSHNPLITRRVFFLSNRQAKALASDQQSKMPESRGMKRVRKPVVKFEGEWVLMLPSEVQIRFSWCIRI